MMTMALSDGGYVLDYFSSDFDMVYRDSQTFSATKNRNLLRGTLIGSSAVCFEVTSSECFYIHSNQDLKVASLLASVNA